MIALAAPPERTPAQLFGIPVGILLLTREEFPRGLGGTLVKTGALKPIGSSKEHADGWEVYGLCTLFPEVDPTGPIPRYRLAVESEGQRIVVTAVLAEDPQG